MLRPELIGDFKNSLVRGQYNLLFGAGVSLDSTSSRGQPLPSGAALREELCKVTGAPSGTSMTRVAGLLDAQQKEKFITQRFLNCRPGPSLKQLPKYLWRRLFTFNVDDVVETVYSESAESKQKLVALNWDSQFEPATDRPELLAIHLHGFARQSRWTTILVGATGFYLMHALDHMHQIVGSGLSVLREWIDVGHPANLDGVRALPYLR